MESNDDFKLLEKQIENNITDWYPFEKNIDYIILKDFTKDKQKELENAVNSLKENGKILILLENDLSIKNIYLSNEEEQQLYNRRELEELLDNYGLVYRKFYYPLPDCKMTNVVFTDKHLPDKETISRNIIFYEKNSIKINEQNIELKKIIDQDKNLFKIFANSFFVECSKYKFEDNEIEFVSFSNMRKEEYRIKTIIKGDMVYKYAANEKSLEHIEQVKRNIDILNKIGLNTLDSYEDSKIISRYQKDKETLDKTIINMLKNGQVNETKKIIRELFEYLKEKLVVINDDKNVFDKYGIEYQNKDIENLTFVKYGLWDLILQNIFYIDNKYYFYDQEWLEENIPIEFIIYRAFVYNIELQKVLDLKEIYEDFNINQANIKLFKDLDNKLQEKTRSELSWKLNTNVTDIEGMNQTIKKLELDKEQITKECTKLLNEKDSRIKFLEDNIEQTCNLLKQKEQEIEMMKNSTSWKITEPLRKLSGRKKLL